MTQTDPYEDLWKTLQRRGVSRAVLLNLKRIAGRWAGVKRW